MANKPYVVHGSFDEHGKQIPGSCNCDVCRETDDTIPTGLFDGPMRVGVGMDDAGPIFDWVEQTEKIVEEEMAALDVKMRESIAKLQAHAEAGWTEAHRAWRYFAGALVVGVISFVLLTFVMLWMAYGDKL
jgi:hypothetical protein